MERKINSVLLIDDDKAINFIHKMVIDKAEITDSIHISLNGKEALDYIVNCRKYEQIDKSIRPLPLLIFLDINMPVMDGWQFLSKYRDLDVSMKEEITIVMVTSSFNPDDKRRAHIYPEISDFKNKPLSIEVLQDIMGKLFPTF